MDTTPSEELVAKIYSAASGRATWEQALTALCSFVQAWAVQIVAFDKQTGAIVFSHIGGGAAAADHLAYVRTYNRSDPRTPLLLSSTTLGWMHCHEILSDEMVASSAFYQDFLIPAGGRYVSGTKIVDDESLAVLIGIHRGSTRGPLGASEIAGLEKLRIHLEEAMAIYRHLAVKNYESAIGYAILEQLQSPTVLVAADRRIRFENASARKLLTSRRSICNNQGFLGCVNVDDNNQLVAELMDLSRATGAVAPSGRSYLRLRNTAGPMPIGVCLSVLRPEEVMGAFGGSVLIMAVFYDTDHAAKPDPFLLAEVFGLTPAEVQVATALSNGHSLEAIAQARGVVVGTIREQLKSLFSKTQTKRQNDLVRRLMALSPDY